MEPEFTVLISKSSFVYICKRSSPSSRQLVITLSFFTLLESPFSTEQTIFKSFPILYQPFGFGVSNRNLLYMTTFVNRTKQIGPAKSKNRAKAFAFGSRQLSFKSQSWMGDQFGSGFETALTNRIATTVCSKEYDFKEGSWMFQWINWNLQYTSRNRKIQ